MFKKANLSSNHTNGHILHLIFHFSPDSQFTKMQLKMMRHKIHGRYFNISINPMTSMKQLQASACVHYRYLCKKIYKTQHIFKKRDMHVQSLKMPLYSARHVIEKTWTYMHKLPKHANLLCALIVLHQLRPSGLVTAHKARGLFFNFLDVRSILNTPKMQILLLLFCICKPQ